jgi:membrane protein
MEERPSSWPLMAYAFLLVMATARQTKTWEPHRDRELDRPTYADGEEAAPADAEKRPRERFENDQPIFEQRRRAIEPGRGRHATAPWQIPWTGWKDVLWRVYASVNDNRLLAVAAGVVFYSLLAIFPAVAAFVSLYGLVADASTIDAHLSLASGVLPAGAVDLLYEQITMLTSKGDARLSLGFLIGLCIALWSANAGIRAIIDALNVVYDEKEKRSFVKLLTSLLFTLRSSRS